VCGIHCHEEADEIDVRASKPIIMVMMILMIDNNINIDINVTKRNVYERKEMK
jgi:hypothetical protein